jgi:hypothetical protein
VNYEKAKVLIFAFYLYNFYAAVGLAHKLLSSSKFNEAPDKYLWPIKWLEIFDFEIVKIALCISLVALSLVVLFSLESKPMRLVLFCVALFTIALSQSYLKISHQWHLHLFTLGILAFANLKRKKNTLKYFFLVQLTILFVYSLSGTWKFLVSIYELFFLENSFYSHYAFASKIAFEMLIKKNEPLLSSFVLDFPAVFNGLLWVAVYIELFALYFAFKPRLHRFIGLSLLLMHLGNIAFLEVSFTKNIVIIGLFLIASPFAPNSKYKLNMLTLNVYGLPYIGVMFLYIKNLFLKPLTIEVLTIGNPSVLFKGLESHLKSNRVTFNPINNEYCTYSIDSFSAELSSGNYLILDAEPKGILLKDGELYLYLMSLTKWRWLFLPLVIVPSIVYDFLCVFCRWLGLKNFQGRLLV